MTENSVVHFEDEQYNDRAVICGKMKVKKLLCIVGAGGHGKVVADIAVKCGYTDIRFFDDNPDITNCGRYPVVGDSDRIKNMNGDVIIAIGNPVMRRKIQERIEEERLVTLVHPDAVIAEDAVVGKGTVVMAGTVINSGSVIGRGCIINTCASVDHDCALGDFVHVAVGAHLTGGVKVGYGTWIGAGAVVNNDVSICEGCMIGTGAVVVRNIRVSGTYVGVPAKQIAE